MTTNFTEYIYYIQIGDAISKGWRLIKDVTYINGVTEWTLERLSTTGSLFNPRYKQKKITDYIK